MLQGVLSPDRNDRRGFWRYFAANPGLFVVLREMLSKENRKLDLHTLEGQPDPELVGTRSTVGGYNLNRDYMKAEAVEMMNLNKNIYYKWWPEVTVDCHTTNGSKHGYELTYGTAMNPASPPEPMEYVRTKMLPEITKRLFKRTEFRTFFYGNFVDEKDPSKGWKTYSHLPRYGSNYRGLTGRMDILSEAYSYIPFELRVKVNREFLWEIFNYVKDNAKEIIDKVKPRPLMDEIPIKAELEAYDEEYEILARDIDERTLQRLELKSYKIKFWGKFKPTQTVKRPKAYVIRKSMTKVIDRLNIHSIKMTEMDKDQELDVTSFTVTDVKTFDSADHGSMKRQECKVTVEKKKSKKKFTQGDILVPADQPLGNLVVYLLEPESDDGLATWGYFVATTGKELNVYRIE